MKKVSDEELRAFIIENAKGDRKFKGLFLNTFGHLSEDLSKEFYQKQIRDILKSAKGRDGWIEWSNMKHLVKAIQPLLYNAKKFIENGNYDNAIYICTAMLEEMTETLQFADDSNGDIGYFINSASEILFVLTDQPLPKNIRLHLFEYCITTFSKGLFSGWDWHLEMLYIASQLVDTPEDADIILNSLDTVTGKYEKERAQSFKLEILKKYKNTQEIEKFITQYISNPNIRDQEIAKAFEHKKFERAIELSKDGISCDEKEKPGLVKKWYDWLLKIAQAQNDTSNIIKYARYRFINNFRATQDYYQILKNNVPVEEWTSFLEKIIEEVTPKSYWKYSELVRSIFITEEWWDKLMSLVEENVSLENIEQNEQYLSKDYASRLIQLYSERIINYVRNYIGRNHYQKACKYLRRMKKLGGNNEVAFLIEKFRKEYPQRRALMDELSRV